MQRAPELDRMIGRAKPDDIRSEAELALAGYEIAKHFKSRPKVRIG